MIHLDSLQLIRSPRVAIKRYSLLVVLKNNSELYDKYSWSKEIIAKYGREFKQKHSHNIKWMFIFDNTLGVTVKELKV